MLSRCRGLSMTIAILLVCVCATVPKPPPAPPEKVSITADVVYGHKDGMALVYDMLQPVNANGSAVLYGDHGSPNPEHHAHANKATVERFAQRL